jgi:hypothetical protein
MRTFASWWERVRARQFGPALITLLALGFGHGIALEHMKIFSLRVGSYWT